jgi:hypothetical protein
MDANVYSRGRGTVLEGASIEKQVYLKIDPKQLIESLVAGDR